MHGGLDNSELERLRRRLAREKAARLEAESIAERGLRDLYARQEQVKLLQKIASAANQTMDVAEALRSTVREICAFAEWPVGQVYLRDGDGTLKPCAIWHGEHDDFAAFRDASQRFSCEVGVGLPGRVARARQPAWIVDVSLDENFPRASIAVACGLRAAFAFPVLVGDEVVGVLEFFSRRGQPLDTTFLEIMEQVGVHLGRVVERQRTQDRLIYDASHDALTGLANRALFLHRLAHAAQMHAMDPVHTFAVLFIDLDQFKLVNDSLGHACGDELIVEIATRLQAVADGASMGLPTLARLGGDEFALLLERIAGPADAMRFAEQILQAISIPHAIGSQTLHPRASIGVACIEQEPRSGADVLRDADIAMYRAKAAGRGRIEVFDASMHDAAVKRLALENDLRRALTREEFVLHYQPIIALGDQRIVGFEALVRWQRGPQLIYPGDFIEVAEETGLVIFLGEWVLEQACRTAAEWASSYEGLTISVNISPRHFAQKNFASRTKDIIRKAGVAPRLIRLELTESVTIVDADRTIAVLSELREFGLRIAIDDFGTGYSSLSYLQRLPLDVLKIDRSFVLEMSHDPQSRQIVQTILSLARGLGMDVVAEGTETASHVLDLAAMGCQYGQGYFFSKPVDAESARALLEGYSSESDRRKTA